MTRRVLQPIYGGTFAAFEEGAPSAPAEPLRFVLPGERVAAGVDSLEVLAPSPERVAAPCPHFGVCGGCDYQHAAYPAQLAIKRAILEDTLRGAGLTDTPALQASAGEPWGYRNRIRLRVEKVDGVFRFGYNQRASRAFLPIVACPIAAPLLVRAASAMLEAASNRVVEDWLGFVAEIEFQTNGSVVQATLHTRDKRNAGFPAFCEALQGHLPELSGAGCLRAGAGYGAKEYAQWGTGGLVHVVAGEKFWVTRGGFFQVNRFLLPRMVELVTAGRAGALAWDLYAGVGLFSRFLARQFAEVVAVESALSSGGDLTQSAKSNKTGNIRAVAMGVGEFLQAAVLQRERPHLIVVDPPRAGLGAEVCALLARVRSPEMVYVSCDPVTLARDLAMLVHSGYRIDEIYMLDMFPQTFHLETIVFLQR